MQQYNGRTTPLKGKIIIQINAPKLHGWDYEPICILLNKEGFMQNDSDILYYNSCIKNEWAIPCTMNKSVCGPLCLNDGEEMQFWKDEYFGNEYFILDLDKIDSGIKFIRFFLIDYDGLSAKRIVNKDIHWSNYSIRVFQSDISNDVLGKMAILERKPLFIDYPIADLIQCSDLSTHCALCTLQKNDKWNYSSLWKGISDIEDELQRLIK